MKIDVFMNYTFMHFKLQPYDSLILGKRLILFPSCENDFKILVLSKPTLEKVSLLFYNAF